MIHIVANANDRHRIALVGGRGDAAAVERLQTLRVSERDSKAARDILNTDHYDLVLRPNVVQIVEDLTWYLDEPFGDTSAIPTYMVSKLAAEQVLISEGWKRWVRVRSHAGLAPRSRPVAAHASGREAGASVVPHGPSHDCLAP